MNIHKVQSSWSDGSSYRGDMKNELRHGYGVHIWNNGERYEGEYVEDKREGEGTYYWPSGARYVGGFVGNKKYGKGVMYLESGNRFEGNYSNDERNGEGTLYYPDGYVDKGYWLGDHLTRLLFNIPEAGPGYQATDDLDTPDLKSRGTSAPKGPLERESQKLIQAAVNGDIHCLETILKARNVYVNVVDSYGHSALLAASIHGHSSAICLLLDEGGHINLLSDEGFSPLSATFHRLYLLQNCPVLNVHQGCLTTRSGIQCSDSSSTPTIIYNAELDTLTPSSPSDISLGDEPLLRDVYTTPRFFLGRRSTALDDKESSNEDIRGLYPESDGNPNTRLVSAPEQTTDNSCKIQNKPILKKTKDEVDTGEDSNILINEDLDSQNNTKTEVRTPQLISQGWLRNPDSISTSRMSLPQESGDRLCDLVSASDSVSIHLMEREPKLPSLSSNSSPIKPSIVQNLENTIDLLLRCSADLNTAVFPLPAIFYPVLAGDINITCRLIQAGADLNVRLDTQQGGSGLLHLLATQQDTHCALGLVKLLLEGGADTNMRERNEDDDTMTNSDSSLPIPLPGRNEGYHGNSPLHILASRMCDSPEISSLAGLLLNHGADPNVVCKGHSPLSLAVLNNNQNMIHLLLEHDVDLNLPLGAGIGNVLCIVTSLRSQSLRAVQKSIRLFKSLVDSGASVLLPVEVKQGVALGTVVDFAISAFQEDKRCSELPFHSMTRIERQRYLSRSKLLKYVTNSFRKAVRLDGIKISQQKLFETQKSLNEIMNFDFTNLSEQFDEDDKKTKIKHKQRHKSRSPQRIHGKVKDKEKHIETETKIESLKDNTTGEVFTIANHKSKVENFTELKMSMEFTAQKYCEYCCKSINVKLKQCNRCHTVYFCSRTCKMRSWEAWHRRECLVIEIRKPNTVKFQEQPVVTLKTTN
ncbi:Ankyrin repeat and MYND domain-containing protein 1-like isoform X9 [Oopsacas minuta]|uniref:Ankyrin repeat and MYND domain-containing protein 1-like isoform X9 n=1 Tax=Oopsacas minuta TaxID=111878 RepID=A0AAV7JZ04_9METZ|nr:Ankyrin repeat and MYND domain-containing protein 1-like isoform X9 [Oopsacas minuta]